MLYPELALLHVERFVVKTIILVKENLIDRRVKLINLHDINMRASSLIIESVHWRLNNWSG